ncbi:MAG: NAD(P)-dependent dehydrogenase (short-subunit alcohol dehydrogenase family) [Planctomycetota bacterium]|jgi:NAD(P)-dependent dehydrogenase (short-subunit alcohol dehydrogenase family)
MDLPDFAVLLFAMRDIDMNGTMIVYGGSGGIGASLSRALKIRGFELHLVARDERRLSTTAAELDATYTVGDVLDAGLFARVADEAGDNVVGLAYAVGTLNLKPIQRLTADDFMNDFQVNAVGAAQAIQASLPVLKKSKSTSSVLLFSSVAASQGFTFHASIGMAKAAINGLTLSLASELSPKVRVNAIAPSLVKTPLAQDLVGNDKIAKRIADMHSLGRLGEPADIAELGAFLLSSDSAWMTGQVIGVDGGRSSLR